MPKIFDLDGKELLDTGTPTFNGFDMSGKDLKWANLTRAELEGANLTCAELEGADLTGANLTDANLTGVEAFTQEQLDKTKWIRPPIVDRTPLHAQTWVHNWGKDLSDTDLTDANLTRAELAGANLTGANLTRVKFGEADLKDTILRHANLTDADLSSVKNLLPEQLAGTNLTRAKLPEHIKNFDGIKQVDDRIKDTGKFFLAMLAADAYSLLALWSTKNLDFKLITDSSDATLPIFNTPLSIVKFCLVAPLVLLGTYVYFQLEMQRLWEELVNLPTIFPDGKRLDQRVYPWFVTSFVQRYSPRSKDKDEAQPNAVLSWVLQVLIVFFVWLATPLVIMSFWLAYIKKREWTGTGWLEALMAISFVWGWVTWQRASVLAGVNKNSFLSRRVDMVSATLVFSSVLIAYQLILPSLLPLVYYYRYHHNKFQLVLVVGGLCVFFVVANLQVRLYIINHIRKKVYPKLRMWCGIVVLTVFVDTLFHGLSFGLIYSVPLYPKNRLKHYRYLSWDDRRIWVNQLTKPLKIVTGYRPIPLMNEVEVSTKPVKWSSLEVAFLQKVQGHQYEVVKLRESLTKSNSATNKLTFNAIYKRLREIFDEEQRAFLMLSADVKGANLRGARLQYMEASRAFFVNAELQGANLSKAQLSEADLRGAHFERLDSWKPANLSEANLSFARLEYATFTHANLTHARLFYANLNATDLSYANLKDVDFTHANLTESNFRGADLTDAHFKDAQIIGAHLRDANLTQTDLNGVKSLTQEQLDKAKWVKPPIVHTPLKAKLLHNWGKSLVRADLTSVDLIGVDFNGIDLTSADFTGAKGITNEQVLKAKWREIPKGLPFTVKSENNWTKEDEASWQKRQSTKK